MSGKSASGHVQPNGRSEKPGPDVTDSVVLDVTVVEDSVLV